MKVVFRGKVAWLWRECGESLLARLPTLTTLSDLDWIQLQEPLLLSCDIP